MPSLRSSLASLALASLLACEDAAPRRQPEAGLPPAHDQKVSVPADLGARAFEHVRNVVAFGPRPPGSAGAKKQLAYIKATLAKLGLKHRSQAWRDPIEDVDFENVMATIPGKRRERVLLCCHHDTKLFQGHTLPERNFHFVGANDGGSGVGLLLALAKELTARDNALTYELVFFDGEESLPFDWNTYRALFGSRLYVRRYVQDLRDGKNPAQILAVVLLDMVGAKDLHIDRDTNSDPRLQSWFAHAAKVRGHMGYFYANELPIIDDHTPFVKLRKPRIPCIDLIDLEDNPQWHTKDDTLEHMSAESLQVVGEVVLQALPLLEHGLPTKPK